MINSLARLPQIGISFVATSFHQIERQLNVFGHYVHTQGHKTIDRLISFIARSQLNAIAAERDTAIRQRNAAGQTLDKEMAQNFSLQVKVAKLTQDVGELKTALDEREQTIAISKKNLDLLVKTEQAAKKAFASEKEELLRLIGKQKMDIVHRQEELANQKQSFDSTLQQLSGQLQAEKEEHAQTKDSLEKAQTAVKEAQSLIVQLETKRVKSPKGKK